jgi:hypothetical protein
VPFPLNAHGGTIMPRALVILVVVSLTAGCAPIKSHLEQGLEDVGLSRQEQHEIVDTSKDVALAPGRHGSEGLYVAAAANPQLHGGGAEIGGAHNDYWWDAKLGVACYLSGSGRGLYVGPTAAAHLQLPTRFTPFVGVGAFAGFSEYDTGRVDENLQPIVRDDAFASIYPEAGFHFWLTDYSRLTAFANYNFTTEGRRHDFWTVGIGVASLFKKL